MIIEHHTFRLADGVTEEEFLAADVQVQTGLSPFRPGFIRRTTARDGADWLVETLWATADDAAATMESDDPAQVAFLACVDAGSASVRRYATLD